MNTVFVADDNNTDRTILESGLRKLGYEVASFSNGTDLQTAIRRPGKPVVALLDWMMPERNGVDICNELATNPPARLAYTIIVTGRTGKSDIAYALDQGADDFVAKPFDMTELRARINVGMRLLAFRQQLFESNERLLEHTRHVETLADERAEQLVRADRLSTIGILSAGIAHEINNPTSFIAVNLQTLEENVPQLIAASGNDVSDERSVKSREFLAMIPVILGEMKNGVARIRNIVDGLKTYTRAGPGKHDWFFIDGCIESALQLCANKSKYRVTVEKKLSATPRVYGDKFQIDQVFVNLFTNAADAIEETGKDGTLTIFTAYASGSVIISVHDTGTGVPVDAMEKIFMPFYTTKAIGKGTGLGLSISRNIIKDHNGELFAENHPEGGTLFKIVLPSRKDVPL